MHECEGIMRQLIEIVPDLDDRVGSKTLILGFKTHPQAPVAQCCVVDVLIIV